MREGPDIALIGSLVGDPARANMLVALMTGKALTASELAAEAGVTLQTASSHLSKLEAADLVGHRKQGRHRYYALADDEVGGLLEAMMGLAARRGHMRLRTGPSDPALRKARVCYNHLAGEMGVRMFDSMTARGHLSEEGDSIALLRPAPNSSAIWASTSMRLASSAGPCAGHASTGVRGAPIWRDRSAPPCWRGSTRRAGQNAPPDRAWWNFPKAARSIS